MALFYQNRLAVIFFMALLLNAGCVMRDPQPVADSRVAPTAVLPGAILDQIQVEDIRVAADTMARDIVMQEFLYTGRNVPVVAIRPIENKTDLTIDPEIFQQTMRVKLMENAGGRILFRDDASHLYTVEERMRQSGRVQISTTTTRTRTTAPTQVGQPIRVTEQGQQDTTMTETGSVSQRVADIDYFLTGLIYSTTEVAAQGAAEGMRYFQFQFRLTNAHTNIIMWEKEYLVKRQARFN
ncbi:hypothetical protein [Desulfonatronum sp. SC1]|uniref:hypothetical protein n=1 Tax=Desulfonatronum sp. SC1 TaxID=2109626 RepID=UPI000D2FD6B4|nr:hypothetical protein [Desulfonatronum sp. SC1]PTN38672.1 hypothetical protein C6366_01680 [Desulfonatronum sp. SC1]